MAVKPWYERTPCILREEISALEDAGMSPEIDEGQKQLGRLVVRIRTHLFGQTRDGYLTYPDLYPYFRPSLDVPGIAGANRHYNPFSGNICLLPRGTRHWQPGTNAASCIHEQLPKWEEVAARSYDDDRLPVEDTQAEPVSAYLPPTAQQIVVDSGWHIPKGSTRGSVAVMLPGGLKSLDTSGGLLGWGVEYRADGGEPENRPTIEAWGKRQGYKTVSCKWCRLDRLPGRCEELLGLVQTQYPQLYRSLCSSLDTRKRVLFAVRFPEEDPNGGHRDGWLFIVVTKSSNKKQAGPHVRCLAVEYAGESDLLERIPELHPLRTKIVAIVGLGCIGAPSVLALAQAGIGELRLLDTDHVSPSTVCRWPLGFRFAGQGKAQALADFVLGNYPFTKIGTPHDLGPEGQDFRMRIGAIEREFNQMECLDRMLSGADLLYDASAEEGVNHLLCDLARERGIPYVTMSSRAGGWGGNVVRIRPDGRTGCYLCYLKRLADKDFSEPPYDPQGDQLQPVGCGDLTFRAAGFDVQEVALCGVRMAVSTP
jgi:molybdopterin/thiamine biosynthesis adenylyltransferase